MSFDRILVVGAGQMGSGIAQVVAASGREVILHDSFPGAIERGLGTMRKSLERLEAKGGASADAVLARVTVSADLVPADLMIEAISEDAGVKEDLFRAADAMLPPDAILASNTSSIPITSLAAVTSRPERVIGMHFFNPVPLMALVEIIPGPMTAPGVVERVALLARRLTKTPVVAADTPGFIVNRVQRALYLEAFRILEEGVADAPAIDDAIRQLGFRLGPFELADVVGTDVNLAAGTAIFEGYYGDPRYRPAQVQRRVVDAGRLGRKSGAGYYDYADDGSRGAPWPALLRRPADAPSLPAIDAAQIGARVLAAIVNEAASAVADGVAAPHEIDVAMRLASNWPDGPIAWGERIGLASVVHTLDALHAAVPDGRYRVSPLLRARAMTGGSFFGEPA
jgi:3-hydroxybutyryl-CoA dehydrogenase